MMKNIIEILKERHLLDDLTSPEILKAVNSPLAVYAGFDPTSESLQIGNLVTIMALSHFVRCGHKVVALIGGATAMIGDPSGKSNERSLLDRSVIQKNQSGVRENLSHLLRSAESENYNVKIVNNNDWLEGFTFIEFLRDVGKHFRMGAMLGKDSVRSRLNSESGMSFTEFSYQLLQAYDFLRLFDDEGCILQIGGSDQWGNITAGIDLIRKLRNHEAFGATMPLVCDSTGQKFGKSEGNAIYLSSAKTSYYDFYQFFIRTEDADVIRFLKIFTFLPIEDIDAIEVEFMKKPEQRLAQRRLADEVTLMIHGEVGLKAAQRASAVIYGESMDGLKADELLAVFADVDSFELNRADAEDQLVVDIAVLSGLCKSKGEARRLIENKGLYVNNNRIETVDAKIGQADVIDGRLLVLRSGKKNYRLVKIA